MCLSPMTLITNKTGWFISSHTPPHSPLFKEDATLSWQEEKWAFAVYSLTLRCEFVTEAQVYEIKKCPQKPERKAVQMAGWMDRYMDGADNANAPGLFWAACAVIRGGVPLIRGGGDPPLLAQRHWCCLCTLVCKPSHVNCTCCSYSEHKDISNRAFKANIFHL